MSDDVQLKKQQQEVTEAVKRCRDKELLDLILALLY